MSEEFQFSVELLSPSSSNNNIQTNIDRGGSIIIPNEVIIVSEPIILKSNITIKSECRSHDMGTSGSILKSSTSSIFQFDNNYGLTFDNLSLDCSSNNITGSNLQLSAFTFPQGITGTVCIDNCLIKDCNFTNLCSGIFVDSQRIVNNLRITGSCFDFIAFPIYFNTGTIYCNCSIDNNHFTDIGSSSLYLGRSGIVGSSEGNNITNNKFTRTCLFSPEGYTIVISQNSVNFNNNNINFSRGGGITINNSQNNIISNNQIQNTLLYPIYCVNVVYGSITMNNIQTITDGIHCQNIYGSLITNNIIKGSGSASGIVVQNSTGSSNSTISSNIIQGFENGIYIGENTSNVTIGDNEYINTSQDVYLDVGTSNITVVLKPYMKVYDSGVENIIMNYSLTAVNVTLTGTPTGQIHIN